MILKIEMTLEYQGNIAANGQGLAMWRHLKIVSP
jgi:hypothetical protein